MAITMYNIEDSDKPRPRHNLAGKMKYSNKLICYFLICSFFLLIPFSTAMSEEKMLNRLPSIDVPYLEFTVPRFTLKAYILIDS